jgi:nitrous oxide reductase accessory protein NosL
MAISERRYAAEMVDKSGSVSKFDNIECMVRDMAGRNVKDKAVAWLVMDREGRQWLDARQACLLKSGSIPGPMGSGILAPKDSDKAGRLAARFSGQVVHFDDLWRT